VSAPAPLRPFWRYYGGKWRSARLYPDPKHDTIIEPFAGAAGYSCHWHWRKIVLVDKSPIIAGIWRYLIAATEREILALPDIPEGGTVDDVDAPQEARWLMGFWCNNGAATPCKTNSAWSKGSAQNGWGAYPRRRVASQVSAIRHWRVIEGEYSEAPDEAATWLVDPPYSTPAGAYYPHQPANFPALGEWCRARRGQVIVCEQEGADWLPFRRIGDVKSTKGNSSEVVWTSDPPAQTTLFGGTP
jgi:hypothetical protein